MKHLAAADLDLAALLRPGDRVVVGQAAAEPRALTGLLARAWELPAGVSVFVGPLYSDTFDAPASAALLFESYGAIGRGAARLAAAGRLRVFPSHYSALSAAFADGSMRADCVMIQLAPDGAGGFNLGLARDYMVEAARHARLVIAEVNCHAPRCEGGAWPSDIPIHVLVEAEAPPLEVPPSPSGDVDAAIARNVASLIPDGAVLQLGVGSIPQAVTAQLSGHRDLGLHSGAMFDGVADLMAAGVVTNARKEIDAGVSVTGLLIGSRRLYDFADGNRAVRLCGAAHTHAPGVLAKLSRFCALNSAIEVDLTGQVNAEVAGGRYVGAVGGQVDFVRGANASPGGRAIVALPSTARGGVSRIVPRVATVSCARADADAIATEWGVAELRGRTLGERVERMIAIAAPELREDLARRWHDTEAACHV